MPKFAFFGTPELAVYALEELAACKLLPALVVTSPDKPSGRGLAVSATPVKEWALARNIAVIQPERFDESAVAALSGFDVFLVFAYGRILPARVLALPARGSVNIHPSLLPAFRGPTPIEGQILSDAKDVGVTIMLMDDAVDHGPIIAQTRVDVPEWPVDKRILGETLAHAGGVLAAEVIPAWVAGSLTAQEQVHGEATYTKKIEKSDGKLDLAAPGRTNYLKYLAYQGWPGTFFFAERNGVSVRVKVTAAHLEGDLFVIDSVIPEGKRQMSYEDFLRSESSK